jgi:hypothetical protein
VEVIPFRPHHSWWVQLALLIWRWATELVLAGLAVWYWAHTSDAGWPTWVQLGLPLLVLAALLVWPWTRRWVLGMFWLLVTRHRLRTYFLQCGAYNRSGRLPWLTLSYPTRVGERVWVWLVPGLSWPDFQADTEQIAVACWARDCRVGRSRRLAGLVWVDVIRRDPLSASAPYASTLLHTDIPPAPAFGQQLGEVPVSAEPLQQSVRQDGPLDVPRTEIDLDALRNDSTASSRTSGRNGGKPAARTREPGNGTPAAGEPRVTGRGGEDVSDWL